MTLFTNCSLIAKRGLNSGKRARKIPVGRGEVRLEGAVLQPRRRSPRGPVERGAGTRAGVPGGGGGPRTGCLSRPLSPPGSGSGG